MLLQHEADPNVPGKAGLTPLMRATLSDDKEVRFRVQDAGLRHGRFMFVSGIGISESGFTGRDFRVGILGLTVSSRGCATRG